MLDPDEVARFRVRDHSGLLALVLALPQSEAIPPAIHTLIQWVQEPGGRLEAGPPRLCVSSIPIAVGFASIESRFDAAVDATQGASWWYNNVSDLSGEHLLEWWPVE